LVNLSKLRPGASLATDAEPQERKLSMPQIGHWFVSRDDFGEMRRIVVDPDNIADDYDIFVEKIEDYLGHVRNQGGTPVKVYIKPAELLAWCKAEGRPVDSRARADYTARKMTDKYRD
jgi:hypothetical protein